MNLDLNLEVMEDENIFDVTMVSNNNPILIGKDGKNLNSIQQLIRQSLKNMFYFFGLSISNKRYILYYNI